VSTIDNVLRPLFAGKAANTACRRAVPRNVRRDAGVRPRRLFLGPIVLYLARELLAILRRDTHGPPPRLAAADV
jgi:hypothetical protein